MTKQNLLGLLSISAIIAISGVACQKGKQSFSTVATSPNLKTEIVEKNTSSTKNLIISDPLFKKIKSSTEYKNLLKKGIVPNENLFFINTILNSDLSVATLKTNNQELDVIIYIKNDNLIFALANYYELENGNRFFLLTTLSNQRYYSCEVNKENKIGNIKIFNEVNWKANKNSQLREPEDCGKKATYAECVACALANCHADWVCDLTCNLLGPTTCLAVIAVGCI